MAFLWLICVILALLLAFLRIISLLLVLLLTMPALDSGYSINVQNADRCCDAPILLDTTDRGAPAVKDGQADKRSRLAGGAECSTAGQVARAASPFVSMAEKYADRQHKRQSISGCREPQLYTAARVRPITVKSTEDQEIEDLAKVPKFKARPLNKKIFESRGDMGIFHNNKRETTQPQEFHFATDERLQPRAREQIISKETVLRPTVLRPTVLAPFKLETENRGHVKEAKFKQELQERLREELQSLIPKAQGLPFTTDIPAVPPKPEPKEATRPAPFQLESLMRHEEELRRLAEERKRAEALEAERKTFRAQAIFSTAQVFKPAPSKKPPTEVYEFQFVLDARAAERAEFDKKMMEREKQYKKFKEECEADRMEEEERIIKAMRKEMVPLARPMPVFVPQRSAKELTRPIQPVLQTEVVPRRISDRRGSSTSIGRRMGQMR